MIVGTLKQAVKALLARSSLEIRRITPVEAIVRDLGVTATFASALVELIDRRGADFFLVQLGANDGVQADPIRSFVLRHKLRGVLVEPVPDVYSRLGESYRGVEGLHLVNAAITDGDRALTLYRPRPDAPGLPDWARGTITANAEQLVGMSFEGFTITAEMIEAIEVQGIPVAEFVASLGRRIDLLQMDCEGYDLRLLRAFPFHTQCPRLIQFEHVHISPVDYCDLLRSLAVHGYRFIRGGEDTCAVLTSED